MFFNSLVSKVKYHVEDIVWHRNLRVSLLDFLDVAYRRGLPLPLSFYNSIAKPMEVTEAEYLSEAFLAKYMVPQTDKSFIDIGADTGVWTLFVAKKNVVVHSFEPSPPAYKILKNKTHQYNNVHTYPFALSNKDGVGRLGLVKYSIDNMGVMDYEIKDNQIGETIEVATYRLDSFSFGDVGVIKIDTEGYETPILEGAALTISKSNPLLIIEVHHGIGKAAKTFEEEQQKIQQILIKFLFLYPFLFCLCSL